MKGLYCLEEFVSHTREVGVYSKGNRNPLGGFKCPHPIAMTIPGNPMLPLLLLNSSFPASLGPKSMSRKKM